MGIKLMSAIFETEFRDLPIGEVDENGKDRMAKASSLKIVLLALADHANEDGECYPGYTRLEKKTGLSRQGVSDVLKALRHNGLVFISEEKSRAGTNYYTISTGSFPHYHNENDNRLLVKPLDYPSQATLLEVVKPLDSNHQLTTNEPLVDNKEKKSKFDLKNSDPAWRILAGEELTQEEQTDNIIAKEALDTFEKDMQTPGNWSWYPARSSEEKSWKYLREFVVEKYKENPKCFQAYQTWRTQPYARGAMSNLAIKRNPENFPASWTDFLASSAMYGVTKQQEQRRVDVDDNDIPISYA